MATRDMRHPDTLERAEPGGRPGPRGPLARFRIRKKLIVLHTAFSLLLAVVLLIALRPALGQVVRAAERSEGELLLRVALADIAGGERFPRTINDRDAELLVGPAAEGAVDPADLREAFDNPGLFVATRCQRGGTCVLVRPEGGPAMVARVRCPEARASVGDLYALLTVALLAVYALVALTLEVLILPRHVYAPIASLLRADRAVREGRTCEELIPDAEIPADELGQIMRSRNESIRQVRRQERELSDSFERIERVAGDLRRKNHLLETARQNLADADRLASLGVMSAGIAHEINTPLAVIKGLVEQARARDGVLRTDEAELLTRVVGRLERLSESLLDFARARPPDTKPHAVRGLVEEAVTLVRIDRQSAGTTFENLVPEGLSVPCDGDRIIQVLVNLVRNAVDALGRSPRSAGGHGVIRIEADRVARDGRRWATVTVSDNGPGIDPAVLPKLFEPFISTTLDARGTGLGLAVAEGIVAEHGGVIVAGNMPGREGARFEILLPDDRPADEGPLGADP